MRFEPKRDLIVMAAIVVIAAILYFQHIAAKWINKRAEKRMHRNDEADQTQQRIKND